jgi:hypothetical protein
MATPMFYTQANLNVMNFLLHKEATVAYYGSRIEDSEEGRSADR